MPTQGLPERVRQFVAERELLPTDARVVVGVSGGVDSMVLLNLLLEDKYRVLAVHVNYRLRGEASDADERLVRTCCEQHNVPIFIHRVDLKRELEGSGESLQARAREIRYAQFERVARTHDCRIVAVAHHADDQIETVLLNLFRGSGPEGLAGMPDKRQLAPGIALIRPLLAVRREEIEAYARRCGLAWREDASNAEVKYRRGFIRNELLPSLAEAMGADVRSGIERSADLMRQYVETSFRPELQRRFGACRPDGKHALAVGKLAQQPEVWRRRVLLEGLRRWLPGAPQTYTSAERLDELLSSQPGRRLEVEGGAVWRNRHVLRFVSDLDAAEADQDGVALITSVPATVDVPGGSVLIGHADTPGTVDYTRDNWSEQIATEHLRLPVTIRRWRDGDRFHPLGAPGQRKVSDFLTDQKVPPSRRRNVLIAEDDEGIIWVVGYRIDERVKVHPETRGIAKISFVPGK